MFKWLARILGLQKKESESTDQTTNTQSVAASRVVENKTIKDARMRDIARDFKPDPGFTRRGVRIPTAEEARRARPATPPPAPPRPTRNVDRTSNDLPPYGSSDTGSNIMMAAVVLSTMDSTPSYSQPSHTPSYDPTPSGGYDSGSCDSGGGGSCD